MPPGGSVTFPTGPLSCDGGHPLGADCTLTLGTDGRAAPVDVGSVPVAQDGSFTATVTIPAGTPPGPAVVVVDGADHRCPQETACSGYAAETDVRSAP